MKYNEWENIFDVANPFVVLRKNHEHIQSQLQLLETFSRDIEILREAQAGLSDEDRMVFWRAEVRMAGEWIEASLFGLRTFALTFPKSWLIRRIDEHSLVVLTESQTSVDDKGKIIPKKFHRPRLALSMATLKTFITIFELPIEKSHLQELKGKLKVYFVLRNRLTHPKNVGDLIITEQELKASNETLSMFVNIQDQILNETRDTLNYWLKDLNRTAANI